MASIRKEIVVQARSADVWDAMRDVGALHTRVAPGFVTDTRLDGGDRIVTFANGMIARERIVDVDDVHHRLVWAIVEGRLTHHNGSIQVLATDDGGSRIVWVSDLLPSELAPQISGMMDLGMAAMQRTFSPS